MHTLGQILHLTTYKKIARKNKTNKQKLKKEEKRKYKKNYIASENHIYYNFGIWFLKVGTSQLNILFPFAQTSVSNNLWKGTNLELIWLYVEILNVKLLRTGMN